MLDSVVEYITQAASSTAFIFCFCNLIIVIILVDLKLNISFDQENKIPLSMHTKTGTQETNSKPLVNKNTLSPQAGEVSHAQEEEAVAVNKIETEGNDNCCNEEEEEEEEEEKEEELRRRVEEFIGKVNKQWKAEYLSTSTLL